MTLKRFHKKSCVGPNSEDYNLELQQCMDISLQNYRIRLRKMDGSNLFPCRVITIIGATKAKYFDDAVGSFDVKLTQEDITYLEEAYVPHKIVGAL